LHKPVAFMILPAFALVNTALVIGPGWQQGLLTANSLGIIGGLVVGKPLGIVLATLLVVGIGLCRLPQELGWRHIIGAGLLGGIGFTMSIFITNLAFSGHADLINASKIAVLLASVCAGGLGFLWLRMATNEK
jgi:NhaA family Na+:H+ antiporter